MEYTEITTYEKACQVLSINPELLPDLSGLPKEEAEDIINSLKLKRIIRALNTDPATGKTWEPNWNDHSQWKYSPWLEVEASEEKPGGFGFSYSCYVGWHSSAAAGSRLCLDSKAKVYHLIEHFKDLLIACYLILR
jgi:hypothetical protein